MMLIVFSLSQTLKKKKDEEKFEYTADAAKNAIDNSNLSFQQKQELRKELDKAKTVREIENLIKKCGLVLIEP